MRILIVGAGIAGLTCALALAEAGLSATVLESVRVPAPLGVGINLLPHATREFAEMGVLAEIEALGVPIEALDYLMGDGRTVWHEPRGRAAGYDWPQIAVHRGRFQALLADLVRGRLGTEAIRYGCSVERVEADDSQARVFATDRLTGGRIEMAADIVIGADGIHSVIRRQFYPEEGRPAWNGVTLFRGVTRVAIVKAPPRMLWAGHALQKFAGYPIAIDRARGEALFNWICDLKTGTGATPPQEDWNKPANPAPLIGRFREWRWSGIDVPSLIAQADGIWQFPMVDRDPLPLWTHGRATLIGDAAHPMYPIGSNGATQAIIDARAIAYWLATACGPDAALAAYEAERRDATSRIVRLNRANGPDEVLELAASRAPSVDDDLDLLLPMTERAEISAAYKRVAGFDPCRLNTRASYSANGQR